MHNLSPLRYPGGKARLRRYLEELVYLNELQGCLYVEPYAGGASVALHMLFSGAASKICINDFDPSVFAFWKCVLEHSEALCELVLKSPLTIEEWLRQRDIYRSDETDTLLRGFATFYLNRTNRSGIIAGAGVIGGLAQNGNYSMGARFPREALANRIRKISERRDDILVSNLDAIELLESLGRDDKTLVYLDPPYFKKADGLYANWYKPKDHEDVRDAVARLNVPWVVSYDYQEEIRTLYAGFDEQAYPLRYSARNSYEGHELMYTSKSLRIPAVESPVSFQRAKTRATASLPVT